MKKALIALGIGIVSFLVGVVGFIFVLPAVAPNRADEARMYLDSLNAARQGVPVADAALHADTVPPAEGLSDAPDSVQVPSPQHDAPVRGSVAASTSSENALRDSLAALNRRLQSLHAENQTLQRKLSEAQKAARPQSSPSSDVASLTETLSKLDDKELRPILQQLEGDVLEELYKNTSGRTQARLLQAMPSDRAASFVQNMVRGTSISAASGTPNTSALE